MSDPFMNVLFDMRHPETNVSHLEHGRRLSTFFLARFGIDQEYK